MHPRQLLPREKKKAAYAAALVSRYAHLPEVKRIARCAHSRPCNGSCADALFSAPRGSHRHVPKAIHKAEQLRRTMEDSQRRKRENVLKHSAPGAAPMPAARKERLVGQLE